MLDESGKADAELAAHLEGCETCQNYLDQERGLRQELKNMRVTAPNGLADRLTVSLQAESANVAPLMPRARVLLPMRRLGSIAALLAACLVTAVVTWSVAMRDDQTRLIAHDAVAAHLRALVQETNVQVASTDSHTVKPWFASRVDFSPPVKDFATEGFTLAGGRLDYVANRRVATLVYKRRLHTVSVFVWPVPGAGDTTPVVSRDNGLQVLSWSRGGMAFAAVSDLNEGELKELPGLL